MLVTLKDVGNYYKVNTIESQVGKSIDNISKQIAERLKQSIRPEGKLVPRKGLMYKVADAAKLITQINNPAGLAKTAIKKSR